jgi:hypothetical protein
MTASGGGVYQPASISTRYATRSDLTSLDLVPVSIARLDLLSQLLLIYVRAMSRITISRTAPSMSTPAISRRERSVLSRLRAHPTWPDPRLMSHRYVHMLLARARTDDLYRDAAVARPAPETRRAANTRPSASARGQRRSGLVSELATPEQAVTLRPYSADDRGPLARLAALDSSTPPPQPVVVAQVGGELRVALSLDDGTLVADPFHLTGGVADLLRAYARQLDLPPATRVSADSSSSSPDMLCADGGLS